MKLKEKLRKRELKYIELSSPKKKKKYTRAQIHEVLQFLSISFYILKLLYDNSLSIVNVGLTILFCYCGSQTQWYFL